MSAGKKRLSFGVAGLVLAFLFVASALVLVRVLREKPDYGRPPRLAAVVDGGKMEEYLESETEKALILRWVEGGAPASGWSDVAPVLEDRCVSCHFTGSERFDMLTLDSYDAAASAAEVRPPLLEKIAGGSMGKYLQSRAERDALVGFVERGAPEAEWPEVSEILEAYCVQCHNPEGVAGLPHLDLFAPVARLSRLPESGTPSPSAAALPVAGLLVSALGALALFSRRG